MLRRWTILSVFVCVCMSQISAQGNYLLRSIDLAQRITFIEATEGGYLRYGTANGDVGTFDGISLDRQMSLDGGIVSMTSDEGDYSYVLTTGGVYRTTDFEQAILTSPSHLHVLDRSEDGSMVVTTAGIFTISGNDYMPDRETFYHINEVLRGELIRSGSKNYLRLDQHIYRYDKSWKEHIVKSSNTYDAISWSDDGLLIGDDKGLVAFSPSGMVDTLVRSDTVGLVQLYKIDSQYALYCAEDQISIYNGRSRSISYITDIHTAKIRDVTVDIWGNIWIAAGTSLHVLTPTSVSTDDTRPHLSIMNVRKNGEEQDINSTIKVEQGSGDLKISYRGYQLTYPQQLEYQTRLSNGADGGDNTDDWSTLSKSTEVEYRNLSPGRYQFDVRATIDGKYYTYAQPAISINVNDPTVERLWIAGLLGILAVLLTAIFFNSRYNRLRRQSQQERKLLVQENKMLSLQQKALQLQMNPHFVFNALNSIQGLIAKEDNKRARKYLQQFSSMMRNVLNQSRAETISIEEEISYLKSYMSLEQMANNDSFDYEIVVDDEVDQGAHIPTMIIQPFIENAILHGIKNLTGKRGNIQVQIEESGGGLICTVIDNGVGREATQTPKKSQHKSVAISVAKDRLQIPGKASPINYIDLKDDGGQAVGTSVSIVLSR